MICPTLNINGTAGFVLKHELLCAVNAVSEAQRRLQRCSPNGRDYPDCDINPAIEEHSRRLQRLTDITSELEALLISVSDQIDK